MNRQRTAALLVAALLWAVPQVAAAQQAAGAVSGTVTDARSGAPVNAAQVNVVGTALNALTGTDGRFLIANVPAGTVTVAVHRIGYGQGEQSDVTVTAGQTTTVNIQLRERALALDEIVVTGTAGGTQKRAIGNVVAQVNADQIIGKSPIVKVDELLGQRTAGVIMLPGTGQVGTGSAIRIRGSGSITQGNEPIVYIDGIRMDSDAGRGPGQRGGANVSRLNDIHPADIQSIEIIKGPAAATLYGTEASNGVVQIITKRGASGAPQFEATARLGTNWLWKPAERTGLRFMPDPNNANELIGLNVYEHEIQNGGEPIFGYGLLQSYNVSARGGTDAVRYFASVSRDNDVGIVDWNWDKRVSLRGNVEASLTDQVRVTLATSYINGQTRLAQGSIDTDPFSNLIWSNPRNLNTPSRGWRNAPPEEWSKVTSRADNDRTTASIELRYQPASWLTNRLVTGLDVNSETNWTLIPLMPEGANHFYGTDALGNKSVNRGTRRFITVDYAGTANLNWRDYSFAPSIGFQYYKTESSFITATGQQFPAIPITTITGGAVRSGSETFSENATVGVYVQQQVGWKNRAFLTAAVRGDDNSAFGTEFDAAIYPKLSGTWVISEEPFWSFGFADELRLRAAWGAAGRQPGTFDAARTFTPVIGFQNQPALTMGQFGNPQLKPERGEELELGFDASLLGGRLGVEFTNFRKRVRDAIVNSPLPPSSGFTGSQIVNIGLIHTGGNELGVNAGIVRGGGFAWDVDTQLATFTNEIKSLGPDLDVVTAGTQSQHRVGYSIADLFMRRVVRAWINESGQAEAECDGGTGADGLQPGGPAIPCLRIIDGQPVLAPQLYLGHSQPRWQIGVGNTFTFFNNLSLYARVEGNGGHKQVNTEIRATHNQATTEGVLLNEPVLQAYRRYENDRTGVYEAGFLRLREVSANYTLPRSMAQRLFAKRAQVSAGFRNVMMLWTKQHGWNTYRDGRVIEPLGNMITWDPEVRGTGDNSVGYQTVLPPTASATMTLRLSF